MIKLSNIAPYAGANEWFESFRAEHGRKVRELAGSAAVEQDVLILAWMWRLGGWAGDVDSYIGHLIDIATSEYDVARRVDQRRRAVDRQGLLDKLFQDASERANGSIEYLVSLAPWDMQQILEWKYISGYTDAEIAGFLGMSQTGVSKRLRKCYKLLKDTYTPIG